MNPRWCTRVQRPLAVVGLLALLGGTPGCASYRGKGIRHPVTSSLPAGDPRFLGRMGPLLGAAAVEGNQVTALINGGLFYPEMLDAIRGATQSVTIDMYIFWSGETGHEFSAALAERAQAGVQVRVLLDWLGSRNLARRDARSMRRAGVDLRFYNRFTPLNPGRTNYRDHRKLILVDGRVGFIGGAGIADEWREDTTPRPAWRDSYYRVEGPVVAQMQSVFLENWIRVAGRVEEGLAFFPELAPTGNMPAFMFRNQGGTGMDNVRLAYLLAFDAARRSIRVSTAYFVPCDLTSRALIDACARGVQVEIVIPGRKSNSQITRPASRASWGRLLRAGARIFEYQPAMYHAKGLVVDDVWVCVGSANFDPRSFRLSDEANLCVWSTELAGEWVRSFEADKEQSREVSYDAWRKRSAGARFRETLSAPVRPLL